MDNTNNVQNNRKSIFEALTPAQLFFGGIVAGVLVLCTIGFFILLSVQMKGGKTPSNTDSIASGDVKGPAQFTSCLNSSKYADKISAEESEGAALGVSGTPATFVNGYLISGALPYASVRQVIDAVLAEKEPDFDFMKDQQTGKLVKVTMPNLPDAYWLGNQDAKVTVVEYSDFQCPYCGKFAPTVDSMLKEYGDKIRFTFRHFPLSFHGNAQKAAEAYECAKEQGKAAEMYDKLFAVTNSQKALATNALMTAANQLGLK